MRRALPALLALLLACSTLLEAAQDNQQGEAAPPPAGAPSLPLLCPALCLPASSLPERAD